MTPSTATALITGASSRIGAAMARDLAAAGWSLALHANRSADKAEALAQELRAAGCRVAVIVCDLLHPGAAGRLVAEAGEALGPLHCLINNASIFEPDEMGALDEDRFDRHYAIHVKAPLFLTDAFAAALPPEAEGLVVNLIDQRVWKPTPKFMSYALSKAALWEATRMTAQALAPRIRVNAIAPGPSFRNERQTEDDFRRQQEAVLLRRGPAPEEFGATVRYFWQARSVTGQMLALDGGQHLAWETADVVGVGE
ncbi:SDR family oxidoreductase [Microvirga tunisiensis]|uniref:SDR family oxidoreductase n=1 Tax=Pannonibacter tanglangensis TaxID=2750084 RepID=A0A7X5EZD2_9HYPH|nr:SDR family oxidoreductase [Pannonibacter sp. XCT-53]NBN76928.1 SDR family oxidoreductase [Pannonibacter sp. XCT-53]